MDMALFLLRLMLVVVVVVVVQPVIGPELLMALPFGVARRGAAAGGALGSPC